MNTLVCPYFGKCGGCSTDKPYEEQLLDKQALIENLLSYYGKVWPIIACKKPFGYRNKVNWEYGCDSKGRQFEGIYKADSHYIIPVRDCLLHDKGAQKIINSISEYFRLNNVPFFNEYDGTGFLRHVLIRRSPLTDQTMVILVTGMWKFQHKDSFIDFIKRRHHDVVTIVQNRNKERTSMIMSNEPNRILYGSGYIEDLTCNLRFRISANSFAQVNPYQASELYYVAMDMANLRGNETVIDAYCGTGTIGLIASASGAKQVLGIESNGSAVDDAIENAKLNNITNAKFICADASQYLKQMAKNNNHADIVFLDPPRTGTDERFLSSVFKLNPNKIIYISCNPYTLNRDLRYIVHFSDYRIKAIQPIDMFPQTSHVETCCLLVRETYRYSDMVSIKVDMDGVNFKQNKQIDEEKPTYENIKKWVYENYGLKVSSLYIAQIKEKAGIHERENYNTGSGKGKVPICPKEKEDAIMEAFRHFNLIK